MRFAKLTNQFFARLTVLSMVFMAAVFAPFFANANNGGLEGGQWSVANVYLADGSLPTCSDNPAQMQNLLLDANGAGLDDYFISVSQSGDATNPWSLNLLNASHEEVRYFEGSWLTEAELNALNTTPTAEPTVDPSVEPTPSDSPATDPSAESTPDPSVTPADAPTSEPTPSDTPTEAPVTDPAPTEDPAPTAPAWNDLEKLSSLGNVYALSQDGFIYTSALSAPVDFPSQIFVSNNGALEVPGPFTYTFDTTLNSCIDGFMSPTVEQAANFNAPLSLMTDGGAIVDLGYVPHNIAISPIDLRDGVTGSTWAKAESSTLPDDLAISSEGVLTGTPTTSGDISFDAVATAGGTPTTHSYVLHVVDFISLNNGPLRFGTGDENSVNDSGNLQQPFYYSSADDTYFKLTYSSYPLNFAFGFGTGGSNWTGNNIYEVGPYYTQPTSIAIDYSGFIKTADSGSGVKGYGVVVSVANFDFDGQLVEVTNKYTLGQSTKFVKIETSVKNVDDTELTDGHIWVGTQDDYVRNTDQPVKVKGNLDGPDGSFQAITDPTAEAKAMEIKTNAEGVLFYSTTPGTGMSIEHCCSFSNAYNVNPVESQIQRGPEDGSYAAVLPTGTLAPTESKKITWFYAAGDLASLDEVAQSVSAASNVAPTVTRGNGQATIAWDAIDVTAPEVLTNYAYRYSLDGGTTWLPSDAGQALSPARTSPRTETISGLSNTANYIFQIAPIVTNNGTTSTGGWSPSSTSIGPLGAPNRPTINSLRNGIDSVWVDFSAPTSPVSPITGYGYRYKIADGSWVTGTTLGANPTNPFQITGITDYASVTVELWAINANGDSLSASRSVTRHDGDPVWTAPTTPPSFTVGTAASTVFTATTSGEDSITYSLEGTLPDGLTFDPATGILSGTPTTEGAYSFRIVATNSTGETVYPFSGTVAAASRRGGGGGGTTPDPTPTTAPTTEPTTRPTATPSPSSTTTNSVPTPAPTGSVILVPTINSTAPVAYDEQNPIPQPLLDFLGLPMGYEADATGIAVLPELAPSETQAMQNGVFVPVKLVPTPTGNGYVLQGDGFSITLNAVDSNGNPQKLDTDGNIILNSDRFVSFEGDGFAPGSLIKLWIFSDPTGLGDVTADANGAFKGKVQLPAGLQIGEHTVQLNGLTETGQVRSVSLGVVVEAAPVATTSGLNMNNTYLYIGLTALLLAVLILLIIRNRKRRKGSESSPAPTPFGDSPLIA